MYIETILFDKICWYSTSNNYSNLNDYKKLNLRATSDIYSNILPS